MKGSVYFGRISDIKIFVHWTFLLLIVWIVFINIRAGLGPSDIFWSVLFILTIFACVTLHELGHALTAKRFNIKTRNITLLPIGGLASLEGIPEKPKEELLIALAGPAVNFVIAIILYPVTQFGNVDSFEGFATIRGDTFIPALMVVNVWLAIFNLIPAFPMDGGRVLRALLAFRLNHARATRIAASVGQVLAIGFVFVGFFSNPFLVFIGLFIFLGAQWEANYAEAQALLQGFTVGEIAMREIPTISSEATIRDAASMLLNSQNKNFIVVEDDHPVGTLNRDEIIKALSERGDRTFVKDVMDKELVSVTMDTPLRKAWQEMQQKHKSLILIQSNGTLTGVIDNENLTEFIMIRTARERVKT